MLQKKPEVDVIYDILNGAHAAQPASTFVSSLLLQYRERGFLTKKQLEGLYDKALKIKEIPAGKLATLEAIIMKMPTRYKSEPAPTHSPIYEQNIPQTLVIAAILQKKPAHKRVLELKLKTEQHIPLQPVEIAELQKFYKLFVQDEKKE